MRQSLGTSPSTVRLAVAQQNILQLVQELCAKGIHVTKRDLFYTDVKLFKKLWSSFSILAHRTAVDLTQSVPQAIAYT